MDRLIREMSYLFTKPRFDALQEQAIQICYGCADHPECFGFVMDAIEEFIEGPNGIDEYEKIIMHYMVMRGLTLYSRCEKITDVQWAHPGWFGTAGKGDTVQ